MPGVGKKRGRTLPSGLEVWLVKGDTAIPAEDSNPRNREPSRAADG